MWCGVQVRAVSARLLLLAGAGLLPAGCATPRYPDMKAWLNRHEAHVAAPAVRNLARAEVPPYSLLTAWTAAMDLPPEFILPLMPERWDRGGYLDRVGREAADLGYWMHTRWCTDAAWQSPLQHGLPVGLVRAHGAPWELHEAWLLLLGWSEASGELVGLSGRGIQIMPVNQFRRDWAAEAYAVWLYPPEGVAWPLGAEEQLSLGRYYERCEQYQTALTTYRRAQENLPPEAAPHVRMGVALEGLGETQAAVASYREAIALNPDNAGALNNLAYLQVRQGRDLAEAEVMARRAVEINPDNPRMLDTLGVVLFCRGAYEEAARLLERARGRALSHSPEVQLEIAEHLAALYKEAGHDHLYRQVAADIEELMADHQLEPDRPAPLWLQKKNDEQQPF